MVSNNKDLNAHDHLLASSKKHHPKIWSLINVNGVISIEAGDRSDLLEFLARTSVGQQLSAKAARSIWERVINLSEEYDTTINELFIKKNTSALQKCGISKAKIKAIQMLKEKFDSGKISSVAFESISYEDLVKKITSLWGFGPWSADMVAIFYNQNSDIWPQTDVAIQRGYELLVGNRNCKSISEYSPYRTYLARHIWRDIDENII